MPGSSIPAKRSADAQEAAWVADEDRFVLQQTRKKAVIRAKSGRAQPIDWLNVILTVIDPDRNPVDDELDDDTLEITDPETVFEHLTEPELAELEGKIEALQNLESSRSNRDYWVMMRTICQDRRKHSGSTGRSSRGISAVSADIEQLLRPKTLPELEKLEKQINAKLNSNQQVDTDYWDHLLQSLLIYKAKAKLKSIARTISSSRSAAFRKQRALEAAALRSRLAARLTTSQSPFECISHPDHSVRSPHDPEPMLRLQPGDKSAAITDIEVFEQDLQQAREKVVSSGYVVSHRHSGPGTDTSLSKRQKLSHDDESKSLSATFDREVARGLGENEELFNAEEEVQTKNRHLWADKHRPRKPQYFNRVALGFEWNKYNQTHYDQDNPPPKVVQGYKFNVFYPDLVDQTKAPRYRIERDDGRKRGETIAPAGEDDTCILRFMAGPPYEDVAFRIVDKEWDYSAKRDRGFKSSFDKGVLQLQFHFKKVYYRK